MWRSQNEMDGEGAHVLTGKIDEWWCVITDEGFFEDLMGPDDLVCVRRFDTELERFVWLETAYPAARSQCGYYLLADRSLV